MVKHKLTVRVASLYRAGFPVKRSPIGSLVGNFAFLSIEQFHISRGRAPDTGQLASRPASVTRHVWMKLEAHFFAKLVSDPSCLYLSYKVIIINMWISIIISWMHWSKYFSCLLNIWWRYWTLQIYWCLFRTTCVMRQIILCLIRFNGRNKFIFIICICYASCRNICGICWQFIV